MCGQPVFSLQDDRFSILLSLTFQYFFDRTVQAMKEFFGSIARQAVEFRRRRRRRIHPLSLA